MQREAPAQSSSAALSHLAGRSCVRGMLMLVMIAGSTGLVRGTLALHRRSAAVTASISRTQVDVQHELDRQEALTRRRDYLHSDRGMETESHAIGCGRASERRLMFDDQSPRAAQPGGD